MRRSRFARRATLVLLTVVLATVTAVLAWARPGDPALFPPRAGEPSVTVYVVHNWMHANLVLPTEALAARSAIAAEVLPPASERPWVTSGWGDAWYYRERGITPARAADFARSLVRPDNPSVLLLDPLPEAPSPRTTGREVLKLTLSERGFDRLVRRLDRSFALEGGRPVVMGRGRDPDSWFYKSVEGSDFTHQCNHWIAELLNAAGVPVTPALDTLTEGLGWDLRLRAHAEPVGGPAAKPVSPETPPAHSGRFTPSSEAAERLTGAATFEAYLVRFASGQVYETAPLALVSADRPVAAGGRSHAAVLQVPPTSLVEIRRVRRERLAGFGVQGLCRGEPVSFVVVGFRKPPDGPYEIALAAYADPAPRSGSPSPRLCTVLQYAQP